MDNSEFGSNKIQLPISTRIESLGNNERIDVTLKNGEVVQGLFNSYIGSKLKLTLVGADETKVINVEDINSLVVPQLTTNMKWS